GVANCLQSLGDLEKRLGNTQQAEERYTGAIHLYHAEGASLGLANALKSLGDIETETGNLGIARDHYEQAIEMSRSGGSTLGVANALQSLGDLERRERRFADAIAHYGAARDLYREEKNTAGLAYTCSELASVQRSPFTQEFEIAVQPRPPAPRPQARSGPCRRHNSSIRSRKRSGRLALPAEVHLAESSRLNTARAGRRIDAPG